MYLAKYCLIALFLLLFSISASSQDQQKATLVDEFGAGLGCEEILARADLYGNILSSNLKSQGVLAVFASLSDEVNAERTAKFIHRALIGRWGMNLNFQIVRVSTTEKLTFQFWIIPYGSKSPVKDGNIIARIPFTITDRWNLGVESGDPCTNHISNGFASVLKSDPGYTGHLVVVNSKLKERSEIAAIWLKYFRDDHGIKRDRLRIFFKSDFTSSDEESYVEFWIKPREK